jgi:hypothetical protein
MAESQHGPDHPGEGVADRNADQRAHHNIGGIVDSGVDS